MPDPVTTVWTMPAWVDAFRANLLTRMAEAGESPVPLVSTGPLAESEFEPSTIVIVRVRATEETATMRGGSSPSNVRNEEEYVIEGVCRATDVIGEAGTEEAIKAARDRATVLLSYVEKEVRTTPNQAGAEGFRVAFVSAKELDQLISADGHERIALIAWDVTVKVRTVVA